MFQFYSIKAEVGCSVNTRTHFLSRLELNFTEIIRLNLQEDIQTTPAEVTTSSTDVPDEKQLFVTGANNQNESEEQTLVEKEQCRKGAGHRVANEEPSSLRISMKESIKIDGDST